MTTTRSVLEREEGEIRDNLLRMGSMVNRAVDRAIDCLQRRDADLAQEVVNADAEINELDRMIEDECLAAIATQQPAASDLRAIVAAMHIAVELERMADHAVGIARIVLRMGDEPLLQPPDDISRMAEQCRAMLGRALDAYVQRDPEMARAVAAEDDTVDELNRQIIRELLSSMIEEPGKTTHGTHLMWAAHNLERVGDRVTNIAERVIFMITGENLDLN